jgi:hypothetical protein
MKKSFIVLEISAVFAGLILRIWLVESNWLTAAILAGILLSWRKNKDSLKDLGFSVRESKNVPLFAFAPLAIAAIASFPLYGGTLPFKVGGPGLIVAQLGWALFQQVILNSYFVNRVESLLDDPRLVVLCAGVIFAGVHAPNPFLMVATGIGGIVLSFLFLRWRNIYAVAFIHAIVSAVILRSIPSGIHHGFVVGPNFFR